MDKVSLGRVVRYVEKNPRLETTTGAPPTVDRAAIVTLVHEIDPNPDDLVDLTVFTPSGPVVVTNVAHLEPPAPTDRKDRPPPPHIPNTWHWPEKA